MRQFIRSLLVLIQLAGVVLAESDLPSERFPHIDVQSTFSESWEPKDGDALSPSSGHLIIINAGWKDPNSDLIVPMNGSESVLVQVQSQDLPILVPNANGFQREMIVRKEPRLFALNPAGRLSFTIPLVNEKDGSFNFRLPELLIRHDDMEEDQWLVVHPDYDVIHRLNSVSASDILSMQPSVDHKTADATLSLLSSLVQLSKSAIPSPLMTADSSLVKRDHAHSSLTSLQDGAVAYNPRTNRISSYLITDPDAHSFDRKIRSTSGLKGVHQFLFSKGVLSRLTTSGRPRSPLEKRSSNDWMSETKNSKEVPLAESLKAKEFAISKADDDEEVVLLSQGPSDDATQHTVLRTHSDVMKVIQHVFQKVGIFLLKVAQYIRNLFRWESIALTHRFLDKFHRVNAAFQHISMTTVNDRIKTSFTKVLNSTDNMYANWFEKLGVKNPHGNVPLMSAKATETLGVEPSTSMGDARINFLHDRIIENINDAAPVNEATFKENILRLMDTGEQLGEELLRAVPKEYRDHVHHLSLQFKDGTSFRNRTMAHLLKIARSLTFIVEEVLSYTLNIMNRIMSMAVQTIMVILDLPFYIPFVTPLWKKMMGSEDLSLMSLFNLIGAIPTTLFYKMYYGRDPFSRNDITALESNKIPQLFLYQWNHHPLTRTTNVHEMKRRTGIFDWIARMSAAYMLQFFVTISLEWPSGPDMPQTPQERRSKNFFAVGGLIIKFLRMIFVYLVCLWIYPVSQLDSTEPGVIIQDMKYPYEVIQVWWYSYQIGLAARVASFANHGKFGAIGDFIWFSVIGSVQAICSNVVAYDIVRATNMKDWKRVLVNVAGITAWEFDSVSFLVGLAPPSAVKNTIEKASLISMYLGYELRAHLMMGLNVVGIIPPKGETLEDHKP